MRAKQAFCLAALALSTSSCFWLFRTPPGRVTSAANPDDVSVLVGNTTLEGPVSFRNKDTNVLYRTSGGVFFLAVPPGRYAMVTRGAGGLRGATVGSLTVPRGVIMNLGILRRTEDRSHHAPDQYGRNVTLSTSLRHTPDNKALERFKRQRRAVYEKYGGNVVNVRF